MKRNPHQEALQALRLAETAPDLTTLAWIKAWVERMDKSFRPAVLSAVLHRQEELRHA